MGTLIGLIAGLVIAGLLFYFLVWKKKGGKELIQTSSVTILEKIEKVFKVVLAEGYYSDVYDYKHNKSMLFDLFKSQKKAILIANARVLVGYDFAKLKYSLDETTKKIIIEQFPYPEVLAIDPEYKFYDTENGILNKFDDDDYTEMINDAKKRITDKAMKGELPLVAAKQMKTLLSNIDDNTAWQLFYTLHNGKQELIQSVRLPVKEEAPIN